MKVFTDFVTKLDFLHHNLLCYSYNLSNLILKIRSKFEKNDPQEAENYLTNRIIKIVQNFVGIMLLSIPSKYKNFL